VEPVWSILRSVSTRRGVTVTVLMSRQDCKNGLSAEIEA
jgi:hypothetical protein